jgi:demethylmenaquinone methyltransferase / 2-methoxy-6-polyprenyl-1,4-benzoquinol methylase
VLKRGGRLLVLEFSQVDVPALDRAYRLFSDRVIPNLGRVFAGDKESYRYLVESIRNFPDPASFSAMIAAAGFKRVRHTAYSGNIAALHSAWKL